MSDESDSEHGMVHLTVTILERQRRYWKQENTNLSSLIRQLLDREQERRDGTLKEAEAKRHQRENQSEINQYQAVLNFLEGRGGDPDELRKSSMMDRITEANRKAYEGDSTEKDQLIAEVKAKLTALQSREGNEPIA